MTVRPVVIPREADGLRVLPGRRALARPRLFPWLLAVITLAVAVLGLVYARTAIDETAFELGELERSIAEAQVVNERLELEIARKESPVRIAPLAEDLGMVPPVERTPIEVEDVVGEHLGRG